MDELAAYDYELPPDRIASHPLGKRDDSRMLVVNRTAGTISHHTIRDLPGFLRPHDCLVLNDTKVLPARLFGTRIQTGGKWEGLYLGMDNEGRWRLIGQTRGRLNAGECIQVTPAGGHDGKLLLTLERRGSDGEWLARPDVPGDPVQLLNQFGTMPLPPYIKRPVAEASDWQRYQTSYARTPGAVAAPTAGLHLTEQLLSRCREAGAEQAFVTLHVGVGTFRPISAASLNAHRMHSEWCELSPETAQSLQQTKRNSGRIVAVGTTSVRTLESAAATGTIAPFQGETDLFIRPGYVFRTVDALLTNFHLPKSTLLVLVSTFAGLELIQEAYRIAVREEYRFFSYGDAMLIV